MPLSIESIFFQAEDGIRDLVRSRGLGDVYKRQIQKRIKDQFLLNVIMPLSIESVSYTHLTLPTKRIV